MGWVVGAAVAGLVMVPAQPEVANGVTADRCSPKGASLLAASSRVRVFRLGSGRAFACLRATGVRLRLDDPYECEYAGGQDDHAYALAGNLLAYGYRQVSCTIDPKNSDAVFILDVSSGELLWDRYSRDVVVDVAANRRGSVAWTQLTSAKRTQVLKKFEAGSAKPVTLDRGVISALRLKGSALTWRKNKRDFRDVLR